MKLLVLLFILVFGVFATFLEFRQVSSDTLFFGWLNRMPMYMLCVLACIYLVPTVKQYTLLKKPVTLLTLGLCIAFIVVILLHKKSRANLDESETLFSADTYEIGSAGGFRFDFKQNGYLKADRYDHWENTIYWGGYTINSDTLTVDIPLDFTKSRQAIISDTTLIFINDTVIFRLHK